MAEVKYVDWDGLVYYDGKIKTYLDNKFTDCIKDGGSTSFSDLPSPSFQNLNYIYKITEDFTSNNYFEKPGYVYEEGTIVQVSNLDDVYLYTILYEPNAQTSSNHDIKELLERVDELDNAVSSNSQLVDNLIKDHEELEIRVDDIENINTEIASNIKELESAVDSVDAKFNALHDSMSVLDEDVDRLITNSATISDVESLSHRIDVLESKNYEYPDLSQYATKDELNEIESKIPTVPTKISELENDAGYITEHQDLSEYAKKSEIPDVTNLATESFVTTKIAEAQLSGGDVDVSEFVTQTQLSNTLYNYATTTSVEELVEETVTKKISENESLGVYGEF